jgi:hypothetical protein
MQMNWLAKISWIQSLKITGIPLLISNNPKEIILNLLRLLKKIIGSQKEAHIFKKIQIFYLKPKIINQTLCSNKIQLTRRTF